MDPVDSAPTLKYCFCWGTSDKTAFGDNPLLQLKAEGSVRQNSYFRGCEFAPKLLENENLGSSKGRIGVGLRENREGLSVDDEAIMHRPIFGEIWGFSLPSFCFLFLSAKCFDLIPFAKGTKWQKRCEIFFLVKRDFGILEGIAGNSVGRVLVWKSKAFVFTYIINAGINKCLLKIDSLFGLN